MTFRQIFGLRLGHYLLDGSPGFSGCSLIKSEREASEEAMKTPSVSLGATTEVLLATSNRFLPADVFRAFRLHYVITFALVSPPRRLIEFSLLGRGVNFSATVSTHATRRVGPRRLF